MLLNDIFNDYLYFIKINRSFGTWDAENDAMQRFLRYSELKNITSSEEITRDLLIDFVAYCKSRNNCNKTINKSLASIRRAFKYSKVNNDDLFDYPNLIETKRHYDYLSDYKINKLLKYFDSLIYTKTNLRNILMIMLLIDTGVRISELLNIQFKYINIKYNYILLKHTKRHRERIVFFTNNTKKILQNYIKNYCDITNNYLFIGRKKGSKIAYTTVETIFKNIKDECHFKKFSPHMLRHTNATILASGGLNEFDLKTLLGHASSTTTQVYVHNNKKMLAKKFKRAFLKGNSDNNYNK